MAGKTDIRWSDGEWAALRGYADGRGLSPGRAVKAIVVRHLGGERPVVPEVRGSGGGDSERSQSGGAKGVRGRPASSRPAGPAVELLEEFAAAPRRDVGGAFPAREVPCEGGCGATIAWDGLCAVCEAEFAAGRDDCPAGRRPAGSAGSAVPVPPAGGGGAASVVDSPPAADAPAGGVSLVSAAAGSLVARGLAATPAAAQVLALRAIRSGQVEVSGEVCRDPQRLVDPRELGVG